MQDFLIEMLECPACHGDLSWRIDVRRADRIEAGEVRCEVCGATYPIQDGIGVFLTPDLPRQDLWAERESWLTQHLRENPEVERRLMRAPLETLGPADQRFRASVLEDRGDYDGAKAVREAAAPVYTDQVLAAHARHTDVLLERLSGADRPIFDLASGAGGLVEEMARRLDQPLVATDFSPTVLRRTRRRLQHFGLFERVSLLAFDARRTPLRDGAVKTLTSYYGLPNITEPGPLLTELRRIVDGPFLSTTQFYDEQDEANATAIRERQLESLLFREAATAAFTPAGWQLEVIDARRVRAEPTPHGVILNAGIDGMPVTATTLEYCVLLAT